MPLLLAVNQPKGTKNESNSQRSGSQNLDRMRCKSTQRYKERKQFTTASVYIRNDTSCKSTQRYKERKQFTTRTVPGLLYFPDLG